jgi:diacylglycerol kinase (ATP)
MTRITLLMNPTAGSAQYSDEQLLTMLERAGYSATCYSVKEDNWEKVLADPGEMVVVAGGDGTVGKVARALIGKNVPLGILSMGTANNVARTLDLNKSPEILINSWKPGESIRLDVGRASGPWGVKYFIESAGMGAFAQTMFEYEQQTENQSRPNASPPDKLTDPIYRLLDMIQTYTPHACRIILDGKDLSGRYLMVEVMNIKSLGPNLVLAPEADPGDGLLDLVLVTENDRQRFMDYLNKRTRNQHPLAGFTVHRGKSLKITWEGYPIRLDDELYPPGEKIAKEPAARMPDELTVEIQVEPQTLQVRK